MQPTRRISTKHITYTKKKTEEWDNPRQLLLTGTDWKCIDSSGFRDGDILDFVCFIVLRKLKKSIN